MIVSRRLFPIGNEHLDKFVASIECFTPQIVDAVVVLDGGDFDCAHHVIAMSAFNAALSSCSLRQTTR
jgi:hypothetical protein